MIIGYATLITIFGVLFISLILTLDLALNRERSKMRRIHLFLLDFFESPVRTIGSFIGIQDVDKIFIQVKNFMNLEHVQKARKKAIFLPHCARSEHCKGRPTENSSAVKRILTEKEYEGVIGIACLPEVKEGMELCRKYKIPALGVPLLKNGCKNTIIDTDAVFQLLWAG